MPPIVATTVIEDANCNENNGSATITMVGDPTGYDYNWSDPMLNGTTVTGLGAGTYYVTISQTLDATCFVIDTINVSNIPEGDVPVVISTTDASCTVADGTAEVTTIDGATYEWGTPSTSTAATFEVTVVDVTVA